MSFTAFNADNCTPLFYEVDGSTGCTLTRANVRPFSKEDYAAQDMKEVGMDKIIGQTKEARLIGVQQSNLMDLILSRHAPIREGAPGMRQSVIAPYRLVPRRSIVNINYFSITAGSVTEPIDPATAFPTTLPATAWYFTVQASTGGYGSSVQNIEKYFLPGMYVYVTSTGRYAGAEWQAYLTGANLDTLLRVQYRVVAAVGKSGDTSTAYVVVAPTEYQSYEADLAAWTALKADDTGTAPTPADETDSVEITKGFMVILANSVSDREAWCYQPPAINNLGLIEYWRQTYRWTHQYNDEYLEVLKGTNMSEFFKRVRTLPIAEQRRQQEMLMQKWYYNTIFWGQRISDKQTVAGWTDLPDVEDITNPGCVLEKKSNTLGIFTQLAECGKLTDMNGAALDLDTIFELAYYLKRERGNDGTTIDTIDLMTDRFTAAKIGSIMRKYYKAHSGIDSVDINLSANQMVSDAVQKRATFKYNKYELPDQGVALAVFTDTYFDDLIGAVPALGAGDGTKNIGRQIWIIDWSDILIGVHGSRSVTRQTNLADNIYNCVIDPNVNHYKLNSRTIEVQVGNVNRHTVIANFSDACPSVTVGGCELPVAPE